MNIIEKNSYDALWNLGFKVYRNGWPDFIIETLDGKIIAFEVKSFGGILTKEQKEMVGLFSKMNIPLYILKAKKKESINTIRQRIERILSGKSEKHSREALQIVGRGNLSREALEEYMEEIQSGAEVDPQGILTRDSTDRP